MQNRKQKVLIISSLGPPPFTGGIENVIDTLMKSDYAEYYQVNIFDTYRKPDTNRKTVFKALYAISLFFKCLKAVIHDRPDLVHIHFCSKIDFWKHSICLLASKFITTKTVFHLHGGGFDTWYNSLGNTKKQVVSLVFKMPSQVIALSRYWYDFLSGFVDKKKIRILPNPVNCDEFSKHSVEYSSLNEKKIILVGSIGKRKGHFVTVKALPRVLEKFPNVKVLFAGLEEDIGAIKNIQKTANDLGIQNNIRFLGPVSGTDKLKLFGSASIVILPSYGENMPISVLEGMASRKPVISSRVGAIRELFCNETYGLLVTPGNWEELSDKILWLLEDQECAKKLGEASYEHVRSQWDVKKIVISMQQIYNEILSMK